jgi:HEAT repeat protein
VSGDKPFVQNPVVAKYYREEFLGELIEKQGLTKKAEPTSNAATFALYYGVEKFPAELEQFLRMRDEYEFVFQTLGEWRIFGREVWLPDPARGNLAEQIIKLDQGNYHGPCILEYSAGCIYLGTAGNGDAYFAAVDPHRDNAEVYLYDHETFDLYRPIADSISSLAYANHLLAMIEESEDDSEATSLKNVAEAFERIKDRVSLSWHYRSLEEAAEAEGCYDGSDDARWLYYRSLWINYLLRNDGVHKLSDVAEVFGFIDHNQWGLERTLALSHLGSLPQTAFYWLWRLFFFDKDEKLRQVIEITKASANPVVRDMALLVEELQNGRKELGSIKDIHALREKFVKLDLDPDRAEEREQEKQEAERRAAEQKAADEKRVAEMLATRSNDELVALAWDNVDNEVIVKPIYDRLRDSEPDLAVDCARIEFYFKGGFHRNDEGDDVLEALGQAGDGRLAPFLLNRGECNIFEAAAHMDGARALAGIAPSLDKREDYHHELRDAVQAVGVMQACGLADRLIAMIGEFSYAPGEFPYDVENKKVLWRLFEALAALRDPRAVAPIAKIAASGHEDLAARALTSLGRLGDASAGDVLLQALSGPFMRPALFGIAQIGDARAIEPVAALLEKRRGASELLVYERLMLDDLRSRCGLPAALDNARLALKVIEANKYECMELHETAIGLLARCLDKGALAPFVRPFLDAEHKTVRYAARKALGTNGGLAPVTYYDRPTVDAIFAREGAEGLRAALSDPRGALRHTIARKAIAENLGGDLEAELVAYGRELLAFEHYTYSYVRDKWERKCEALGLIASMGGEAADRLAYDALTHPNWMMQEPFQYRADTVKERAQRFGPLERRRAAPEPGKAVALSVEPLGKTPWSLGGTVNGVQFSSDGQLREANSNAHDSKVACVIALGDDEIASAAKGSVIRWSLKEQAPLMTRGLARADGSPMRFCAVAASPDRRVLLATGFDGAVALQAKDGAELWRQPALKRSEVALGVEGAFIVGSDQVLVWLDAQTGQPLHVESLGGDRWAEHLLPLTGARAIAAASRAPQLSLYDLSAPRRLAPIELPAQREKAETCCIAAGGGKLVVSRWDRSFDVLDAESLQHRFEVRSGVRADPMAVSPDGALVACGENELLLFDAETFDLRARRTLGGEITALCFVGARRLIAGLSNGQLVSVGIA